VWLISFTTGFLIFFIGIFLFHLFKTFSSDLICCSFCISLDSAVFVTAVVMFYVINSGVKKFRREVNKVLSVA